MALVDKVNCEICKKILDSRNGFILSLSIIKNKKCPHGIKVIELPDLLNLPLEKRYPIEKKHGVACNKERSHFFSKRNNCVYCYVSQEKYMKVMSEARYSESNI